MKRALFAAILLLATQTGWAGVQYEFVQNSQSDLDQQMTHLMGRAVIDGQKSRVDFVSGNIYAPGAYVISLDGSRNLTFVDPVSKTFSEVNASAVAAYYGARNVVVSNLKTNLETLPDTPSIAGVPTTHYRLTITYDVSLVNGSIKLMQRVKEETDKWTTTRFGDVAESFIAGGTVRTGNPELDKVLDAELSGVKGFPLRQKTVITTTNMGPRTGSANLKIPSMRTQTREFQIQTVKEVPNVETATFSVPTTFQKIDPSQQQSANKPPQVTILSFEKN